MIECEGKESVLCCIFVEVDTLCVLYSLIFEAQSFDLIFFKRL